MLPRLLAAALVAFQGVAALRTSLPISELREIAASSQRTRNIAIRDADTSFPEQYFDVPIDHFHNESAYEPHTSDTFKLRYWFDAKYYQKGGPVYLLSAGEVDGDERVPFLEKGIIHQLAKATGGVAVVLEHRYYGKSFPVDDLSVENLRFCTTEQAMADTAYFAQNIVFPALEHLDLTAGETPYIAYGGSYAGAFVAIMRKIYPDIFWAAISSSGVTAAVWDYWQYYEAARIYGPKVCVEKTQKITHVIDNILRENHSYAHQLKTAFGLPNITYDNDFTKVLARGISGLQSTNWDPSVNDLTFDHYCGNVSTPLVLYPELGSLESSARELITAGGYEKEVDSLLNHFLNYIGYVGVTAVSDCESQGKSQDECFSNHNSTFYAQTDISQTWRSWPYQYCKQWGYMQGGDGVPEDQLPMVSRLLDLEYNSMICRQAFNITELPDLESINKYGGFDFSFPRVALLDGENDPWRGATPHAIGRPDREHTVNEPFWMIAGAVHHWDENGVFDHEVRPGLPPTPVQAAQEAELSWVKEWLREWEDARSAPAKYDDSDNSQVILDL